MNNLLWYFLFSECLFFLAALYQDDLLVYNGDLTTAYAYHAVAIASFSLGYLIKQLTLTKKYMPPSPTKVIYRLKPQFYFFSYLLIVAGIAVTIAQIAITINPLDYMSNLLSGNFQAGLRDAFLLSSAEGGLSGVIKMFGVAPLSVYLFSLGILTLLDVDDHQKKRLVKLNRWALAMVLVKVLLSLDRMTIMAILVANFFRMTKRQEVFLKRNLIIMSSVVMLGSFLSSKRIEGYGILNSLFLYLKLGIVNLQNMIDSLHGHTYGFSTLLSPFTFISRALPLPLPEISTEFNWEWNPAQYTVSYSYQDFGVFFFLLFLILGYVSKKIDFMAIKRHNIYFVSAYFMALYGLISLIAVPAFRGMEFWLAILIPLVLIRLFAKPVQVTSGLAPNPGS